GPALLPDEPWAVRGRSDGDDRAGVRRADRARAADGVRPRAQPADRAADGRGCRITVTDLPVPTGRDEAWRFTPVSRLRELLDAPTFTGKLEMSYDAPAGVDVTSDLPAWVTGADYAP